MFNINKPRGINLFVIHRFGDKKLAKAQLKKIERKYSLEFQLVFLDSCDVEKWKQKALDKMLQAKAIVVFDRASCQKSKNTSWEIEKAENSKKEIIYIDQNSKNFTPIKKLKSLYDFKDEFEQCFSSNNGNLLDLYKIMVESSESLVRRRQQMNSFFITAIASLVTVVGLLIKTDFINSDSLIDSFILVAFLIIIILLCNSWHNLIDNYGKLNKAKFDVILQLEKSLDAQVYLAEWIALGKGMRSKKYRSFTTTEKNIPIYFGVLLGLLAIAMIIWIFFKAYTYT